MRPPAWLPNAISVLRVLLVPVWVLVAEAHQDAFALDPSAGQWRGLALGILVLIGVSDIVDGTLARRYQLTTRFGATLDAVADKLAQVVLFTWLALRGAPGFDAIPLWFIGVLIARDVVLVVGYWVIRRKRGAVSTEHAWHGKFASVLLFALLVWVLWGVGVAWLTWVLAAIAAFVGGSTALYVREGFAQLRAPAAGQTKADIR